MAEPQLDYEQRTAFVSRRQYRRLMALTLLNTIMLAGFIVGPSIGPMARSQWQQFQNRREQRRIQQQQSAAIATAKAYVAPDGLVVYDERPDEAAKLLASDPTRYRVISDANVPYLPPRPWQAPVQLKDLPVPSWGGSSGAMAPAAFIGARKSPGWPWRLVVVSVRGVLRAAEGAREGQSTTYRMQSSRSLLAQVIADDGGRFQTTVLIIGRPETSRARAVWTRGDIVGDRNQEKVDFDPAGLMCLYAGRCDSADASHFTIDYETDGRRGTIDGWLRDGERVDLVPHEGAMVDRDPQMRHIVWELHPPGPATAPARQAASTP